MINAFLVLTATTVGTATITYAADVDTNLRTEIERIAQKRIFFGHQSIGVNLLDGIKQLASMAGVSVHVQETPLASSVGPATIGHTFVAKNGEPLLKLQNFRQAFGQEPTGIDIAMVKFCFLDFTTDTDVKALFASYQATIDELKTKNPGTTFVHVTAPLTDVEQGLKGTLKRLIGRAPYGTIENIRREEYNTLMRQAYQGHEPIFDLARAESTTPEGIAVTVEWKGSVAPAMASIYTDDGSHLNAIGKQHAARQLISILAAIPNRKTTSGTDR